jgi:hypothetical protein
MFRKIKFAIKDNRQGVTSVQAINSDGTWNTITEKEDIEIECTREKQRRFTQAQDSPPRVSIKVTDQTNTLQDIKQNQPHYGEIVLGIAFSPSGHMKEEAQHLRNKTLKWATSIAKANLNHYEAWAALTTTIFKAVEYAQAATIMPHKYIRQIISPALSIALPKAGICRKISRKIVFCPVKYQGFGL